MTRRERSGAGRPRVYDCFLFFRELDLLEIRLRELADVVDTFVLVESRYDFAGREKPLHYKANRSRFAAFADRIRHIEVLDEPADADQRWVRQRHQRAAILTGLADSAPDDLVLLSDVDEIPSEATVAALAADPRRHAIHFLNQPLYRFYLDVRDTGGGGWIGTRAVRARHMIDPTRLRKLKPVNYPKAPRAYEHAYWAYRSALEFRSYLTRVRHAEAGWHFSSVGDLDYLLAKDQAIAFDEMSQHSTASIADWDRHRAALSMNIGRAERLSADAALPKAVREDPERYAALLAPQQDEDGDRPDVR
ncbi:hypothetical protein [Amorphus orientalis]|uniref:Beta-1,4-mannosyl-glycoprotein beta-1,4-N-acetylglucosaminyltransferase n=1 Tax=Amorphus orientalis TaxID=649198 RepID=A0AAE3VS14_9HYPH|nr:hypothetical protein [Amorphus orientalis]MDQ0317150.1 beta-1,4-mannosyl-glycoprotein beta-1,4-N-acetylglucosaminyltransferase [Amorphus orientalis]